MNPPYFSAHISMILSVGLFLSMLATAEVGRREALRANTPVGSGLVETSVLGLLALLLAFSFGWSASRFDIRRQLTVDEANAIGTAYLRISILPEGAQTKLRVAFKNYLETRLRVYEQINIPAVREQALADCARLQREIWTQAVDAARLEQTPAASMLLLPALNSMIDISTSRTMAAYAHVPLPILILLFCVALVSSIISGRSLARTGKANRIDVLVFALVVSLTIYVILDLEYPRTGVIRLDYADQALRDLRASMDR